MAGAENPGPEYTVTDIQGWKTRELTTQEPIAGVEKAEPDNASTHCTGGKAEPSNARRNRKGGKRQKAGTCTL